MLKILLTCYALLHCFIAYAMEHLNTIQDIPKLPLAMMSTNFNNLPAKTRYPLAATKNAYGIRLSQSLIFNIAQLEEEGLKIKILSSMLDGDEKSAKIFFNTPFWYASKKYHEAQKMLQKSSLKKQPIGLLFRLPAQQQTDIMELVTQSRISRFIYSRIIINEDEHEKIKLYNQEIQENFFVGENIAAITEAIKTQCIGKTLIAIFGGYSVGLATILITNPPGYAICEPLIGAFLGITLGGTFFTQAATEQSTPIDLTIKNKHS